MTAIDLVVVGGGGGGLSAAIAAALSGARVVLLEKEERCGGNTARSIGSIPGAGSRFQEAAGVEDSPQRFVDDVTAHTHGEVNAIGLERLAGQSADLVHWLTDVVELPLRLTEDYRHVGHGVTRLHNPPGREGRVIVDHLSAFAESKGVEIRTSSPAADVSLSEEGTWLVSIEGGETLSARSVILATDGFGANPEMMAEYCSRYVGLAYFGGPGNVGDGIRFGLAAGGVAESMTAVLGFAIMGVPEASPSSWDTMVSWTVIENGGIVVDAAGRRFGDESVGYSAFVDAVVDAGQPLVYAIFDERILQSVSSWEERFRLLVERADSPVKRIDRATPPFGIDAAELDRTLAAYAAAASGDAQDEFGREDTGWAPFGDVLYAARAEASVLTTLGGLVVGQNAEVLDAAGSPIPGLYAVGGTAQTITGLAGAGGYISGSGLLAALGYGYLAGTAVGTSAAG